MAVGADSLCTAPARLMRVVRTVSGPAMFHLEADVVDLCFNAPEAVIERLHDLNVGQCVCGGGFGLLRGLGIVAGSTYKHGGGSEKGPTTVARVGSASSFGHGRPIVPQTMSQMTMPSTS